MKRLTLKQNQIAENKYRYRVLQVANAVTPKVDTILSEAQASEFCRDVQWNVTIKAEL